MGHTGDGPSFGGHVVLDAVRGYLQLASGLTEVTRQRATATAKSLLTGSPTGMGQLAMDQAAKGQAAVAQIAALADEIVATSRANRELLVGLIRAEVDRAVGGLGLVTQDDFGALQRKVDRLAGGLAQTGDESGKPAPNAATKPVKQPARKPAKKPTQKAAKSPVKKPAKKPAKQTTNKSAARPRRQQGT